MEDPITKTATRSKKSTLENSLREACKKIAPLWPLENFVAVNPYLGLTDQKFDSVAQQLATIGGIQMTLPPSFYLKKIETGEITRADLKTALRNKEVQSDDVDAFLKKLNAANSTCETSTGLPTLLDAAAKIHKQDWDRFITNRISNWAAAYFDTGQASWKTSNQKLGVFNAWKTEAEVDLTPEISGLKGFREAVKALPNLPLMAAQEALETLGIEKEIRPVYLHRLLLRLGGWSAHAARLDWETELKGGKGNTLLEFLCILICWEACMLKSLDGPELYIMWSVAKDKLAESNRSGKLASGLLQKLVLQEAFDLAMQRSLISKVNAPKTTAEKKPKRPSAQAVFCIDVRSEVYRRHLEQMDTEIETIGFAGFFAFPINFVPIAHSKGEAQCPVLIPTGATILEEIPDAKAHNATYKRRIFKNQIHQIWKSFKSGAVSCFSFVSPLGLSYLPKLFSDAFRLTRPVPSPHKNSIKKRAHQQKSIRLEPGAHFHETAGIPIDQRAQMAKNALKAMSLSESFAPFVLLVGHGASTVNNPHATGLDCGACGGHSGEANAKVAAAVLNDPAVRTRLLKEGIEIPDDTVFLACLHDTTTDEVRLYNEHQLRVEQREAFLKLKASLAKASAATRSERALRMKTGYKVDKEIFARSKDWSQVRPELGLAGCSAFVVANRTRTKHLNLQGEAFLHSYDWKKDTEFSILELIMTAPMVVTSWINLQYYASTVDNKTFGSGNKTLHNVTAGIGVLEGYAGDLRVGLPLQSLHDGEDYQHKPLRLSVLIEAPMEAMNRILEKHQSVKNLCDNGWISLMAINEEGKVTQRYKGDLNWTLIQA